MPLEKFGQPFFSEFLIPGVPAFRDAVCEQNGCISDLQVDLLDFVIDRREHPQAEPAAFQAPDPSPLVGNQRRVVSGVDISHLSVLCV